jgi:hypothetical protein
MSRVIKPDSGQSLVIQDEGGDAALTIDTSGNTTLAGTANNIGTVTSGTFNGTIGSSATHQDKHTIIDDFTAYKLTTNGTHSNTGSTETVATRSNGNVSTVEAHSVISGYTYIYTFGVFFEIISANSQNSSVRDARVILYDGDTSKNIGDTSSFGTELADTFIGREATAASTGTCASFGFLTISGAVYYSSDDTRYIYLTTTPAGTNQRITLYYNSDHPGFLRIEKIKGDVISTKSN